MCPFPLSLVFIGALDGTPHAGRWINGSATPMRLFFRNFLLAMVLVHADIAAFAVEAPRPIDLGSRRELFVDDFLIEQLEGVQLRLREPRSGGVAIRYDDGNADYRFSFYTTVFKDGPLYRMYYRGHDPSMPGEAATRAAGRTCYAESADGTHWIKRDLGRLPIFNGSRDHNIVMPFGEAFTPFIDTRPGVPPTERYKAVMEVPSERFKPYMKRLGADAIGFESDTILSAHGLLGYVSANAIEWRLIREEPIAARDPDLFNQYDGSNAVFWSEAERKYVMYQRHAVGGELGDGGIRATARSTSTDFVHWSKPIPMTYSDTGTHRPEHHLYVNNTQPYFRAPHIYIALQARIMMDRQALTDAQARTVFPDPAGGGVEHVSDTVLLTTRPGSTQYDFRFKESFVRPGIGFSHWTSRTNYAALGIVPTSEKEMSFYVQRNYAQKHAFLERMVLRLDGFASASAPYEGGALLTKTFTFAGKALEINYATSAAGGIRVAIVHADGQPIEGFSLNQCPEIIGDEIARTVAWDQGTDVSSLSGKPVRLQFWMHDADLFSFRFAP